MQTTTPVDAHRRLVIRLAGQIADAQAQLAAITRLYEVAVELGDPAQTYIDRLADDMVEMENELDRLTVKAAGAGIDHADLEAVWEGRA